MPIKIIAVILALQLLPLNIFAQNFTKNQEVEILLGKPAVTFKSISDNTGINSIGLCAMAGAAAAVKNMPKNTLEEATSKILEIMQYLQRNNAVYEANPALKRKLSEAFLELRHKYTYEYMRSPVKNQALPSMISNDFVFVLDNLKYPKGNEKLKQLVKEFNKIVGHKKSSNAHIAGALVLIGAIITLANIPGEVEAEAISNKRTVYTRLLNKVQQKSPSAFALTAIELASSDKKLVADIISQNDVFYPLLKEQIDLMTSPEAVQAVNNALQDKIDVQNKKAELKTLFKDSDLANLKEKYRFNY